MTKELLEDILYIDIREPVDKITFFISQGLVIKRIDLEDDYGLQDYYFKNQHGEINIERKAQNDFDGSVNNGHIWDQAATMTNWMKEAEDRHSYIIFVGETNIYNSFSQTTSISRMGAIGSITGRGVPVLPATDETSFNYLLYKFIRMLQEDKFGKVRPVDIFKYKNPDAAKIGLTEHVLRYLPGVGQQRAYDLSEAIELEIRIKSKVEGLDDFEALTSVNGVGKKTAEKIYDILEGDRKVDFTKEEIK